jgi:hypothetical protein
MISRTQQHENGREIERLTAELDLAHNQPQRTAPAVSGGLDGSSEQFDVRDHDVRSVETVVIDGEVIIHDSCATPDFVCANVVCAR